MTLLQPQTGKVPVPHPGTLTQPYWDGCARHELLFQRCGVCGHATHTPAYLCSQLHRAGPHLGEERGHG